MNKDEKPSIYSPIDLTRDKYGEKKPGTRKVADLPKICNHPEHGIPMGMVFEDGVWEHVCPGCGHVQHFTVRNPTL